MSLPEDFLAQPAPQISVSRIDFATHGLTQYDGLYAVILDNVISPQECDTLVQAAEASTSNGWEPALVNIGGGEQRRISELRDCGRIIWDSRDVVARLWSRIAHVPEEIMSLHNVPRVFGKGPQRREETWEFTRLNERMRFLKYVGGEYFRPHCDGIYETPDGRERSYFTLHLYLNNASVLTPSELEDLSVADAEAHGTPLVGGATTFHTDGRHPGDCRDLDVMPEAGRILLFQHRDLVHSGEDVLQGTKYTMRTDLMYSLRRKEDDKAARDLGGTDGFEEAKMFMY